MLPLEHKFVGGAGSFFVVGILQVLVILFTLGIALPWAVAMHHRWQAQNTLINGQRVEFVGSGGSLFGHWIKWFLLCIITLGIYSFWVVPRMTRWIVENYRVAVPIPHRPSV